MGAICGTNRSTTRNINSVHTNFSAKSFAMSLCRVVASIPRISPALAFSVVAIAATAGVSQQAHAAATNNLGSVTIEAGQTFLNADTYYNGGAVTNYGTWQNTAKGQASQPFGIFNNYSGTNFGTFINQAGASILNAGWFRAGFPSSTMINNGSIVNSGVGAQFDVRGSLTGSGSYIGSGYLGVSGRMEQSTISILEGGSLAGSGEVASTVSLNGGTVVPLFDGLDIDGDFHFNSGTMTVTAATTYSDHLFVSGDTILSSGTFKFFFVYEDAKPVLGQSWVFLHGNVIGSLDNYNFVFEGKYSADNFSVDIVDEGLAITYVSNLPSPHYPSPIPIPGGVWLFGSSLVALLGARRIRSAVA